MKPGDVRRQKLSGAARTQAEARAAGDAGLASAGHAIVSDEISDGDLIVALSGLLLEYLPKRARERERMLALVSNAELLSYLAYLCRCEWTYARHFGNHGDVLAYGERQAKRARDLLLEAADALKVCTGPRSIVFKIHDDVLIHAARLSEWVDALDAEPTRDTSGTRPKTIRRERYLSGVLLAIAKAQQIADPGALELAPSASVALCCEAMCEAVGYTGKRERFPRTREERTRVLQAAVARARDRLRYDEEERAATKRRARSVG